MFTCKSANTNIKVFNTIRVRDLATTSFLPTHSSHSSLVWGCTKHEASSKQLLTRAAAVSSAAASTVRVAAAASSPNIDDFINRFANETMYEQLARIGC